MTNRVTATWESDPAVMRAISERGYGDTWLIDCPICRSRVHYDPYAPRADRPVSGEPCPDTVCRNCGAQITVLADASLVRGLPADTPHVLAQDAYTIQNVIDAADDAPTLQQEAP